MALARVSSREQEQEGFSLEVQEEGFHEFGRQNKAAVDPIFRITETATKAEERREFKKMLQFAKKHAHEYEGILFYKIDRAARNLKDLVQLEELESEGFQSMHFGFKMEEGRTGFTITGDWGKSAYEGFANKGAAKASAVAQGLENPLIREVNGEYFIQMKKFYPYRWEDAAGTIDGDILHTGAKAQWLFDDLSKLSQRLAKSFIVAADKEYFVSSELSKLLKPIRKVRSSNERIKLGNVLELGNKFKNDDGTIGRVFTTDELRARGITNKKTIEAYHAYRRAEDVLYAINDLRYRNRLIAEGMKHIQNGDFVTVARPIPEKRIRTLLGQNDTIKAIDPKTGSPVTLTKPELEALYRDGNKIARLRINETIGNQEFKYVIAKKLDRTKIEELPQNILNYRKGYITRFYKDRWFVKRYNKQGKVVEELLKFLGLIKQIWRKCEYPV